MTKIEWTDETWNPITGCTKVSQGCKNCYAERMYERFNGKGTFKNVTCHDDRLLQPLKWKKGRKIFVNSMSDLFHEEVPFAFIDSVFAIMALSPQHTFQILTKRPARMLEYFSESPEELIYRWGEATHGIGLCDKDDDANAAACQIWNTCHSSQIGQLGFPLFNVWLGVSCEDQKAADERIPLLLQTPATVRFLSCEPLLGMIDLLGINIDHHKKGQRYDKLNALSGTIYNSVKGSSCTTAFPKIHWVIVGGESGPKARPMHPKWVIVIMIDCKAWQTPLFFKQWGEWIPGNQTMSAVGTFCIISDEGKKLTGEEIMMQNDPQVLMVRNGKKKNGRMLDGIEYSEFPKTLELF